MGQHPGPLHEAARVATNCSHMREFSSGVTSQVIIGHPAVPLADLLASFHDRCGVVWLLKKLAVLHLAGPTIGIARCVDHGNFRSRQSEGIRYVPAAQEAPERDVREHDVNFLAGREIGDSFLAAARFEDQPAIAAKSVGHAVSEEGFVLHDQNHKIGIHCGGFRVASHRARLKHERIPAVTVPKRTGTILSLEAELPPV
jgi:hypothetical protein